MSLQSAKFSTEKGKSPRLIVGLGNPGSHYESTRHNLGFSIVRAFSEKKGFTFQKSKKMQGELAQGMCESFKVYLLLPMTYMNRSGISVKRCLEYFKMEPSQLIVIVDDVAIPFGTVRLRHQGSFGGHNGLKSIEEYLQTREFARLRVGIGSSDTRDLADYVLSPFSQEEAPHLPEVRRKALDSLESWLFQENPFVQNRRYDEEKT